MKSFSLPLLYYGDNLKVLRESFADASVDLVYLDPPFNSNANYNILFKSSERSESHAQIEAFEDTWHWTEEAQTAFDEVMKSPHAYAADMLRSIGNFLGRNDMMAYLSMMTIRLIELHRVLKDTGSLYLHCDPTASHYLKLMLDGIFGKNCFRNEIIWKRSHTRSSISRNLRKAHDVIFCYSKTENYTYNLQYRTLSESSMEIYAKEDEKGRYRLVPLLVSGKRKGETGQVWRGIDPNTRGRQGMHWVTVHKRLEAYDIQGLIVWPQKENGAPNLKYYLEDNKGVPLNDMWDDVPAIQSNSPESLGYPTQKPVALLERIINASSNEGDIVLDPFCGCGTAVHAAEKLGRRWAGIDITNLAISLIEKRLSDAFSDVSFTVHGTPKDMDGARALSEADKYQFQWWAVSLVGAVPCGGKKKGADGGVDGLIFFKPDGKTTEKAIVSVKGGRNVDVKMIRELANVIDREDARIGLFITLAEPTKPMLQEAVGAGFYETEYGRFPRIQILTIDALFAGAKPRIPLIDSSAFKKAATETRITQGKLEL
jgi:site-specific DNA-methyltransferase (adenine-specific)